MIRESETGPYSVVKHRTYGPDSSIGPQYSGPAGSCRSEIAMGIEKLELIQLTVLADELVDVHVGGVSGAR